jgi:hypothetical protein
MRNLLFAVHQHGGDDVTWKPRINSFTLNFTKGENGWNGDSQMASLSTNQKARNCLSNHNAWTQHSLVLYVFHSYTTCSIIFFTCAEPFSCDSNQVLLKVEIKISGKNMKWLKGVDKVMEWLYYWHSNWGFFYFYDLSNSFFYLIVLLFFFSSFLSFTFKSLWSLFYSFFFSLTFKMRSYLTFFS